MESGLNFPNPWSIRETECESNEANSSGDRESEISRAILESTQSCETQTLQIRRLRRTCSIECKTPCLCRETFTSAFSALVGVSRRIASATSEKQRFDRRLGSTSDASISSRSVSKSIDYWRSTSIFSVSLQSRVAKKQHAQPSFILACCPKSFSQELFRTTILLTLAHACMRAMQSVASTQDMRCPNSGRPHETDVEKENRRCLAGWAQSTAGIQI